MSTDTAEIEYRSSVDGISAEQLTGFFVGWPSHPSPEGHLELLRKSHLIELAVDSGSRMVVGFINAITDGVMAAYLPLLEVLPEYQHRGIGGQLVERMLGRLSHLYMVDLTCDPELQPFYSRFGLRQSTCMMKRNHAAQSGVFNADRPE